MRKLLRFIAVMPVLFCLAVLAGCGDGEPDAMPTPPPPPPPPPPTNQTLDLLSVASGDGLLRAYGNGSSGNGRFGLPVAGGYDVDGDGHLDFARASMISSPLGRTRAGSVQLIFGNSQLTQDIDLAMANVRVLTIYGDGIQEATGGEVWMADLTGDGVGDLIIGRPNFRASSPDRIGAGALTIIVGGPELRDLATNGTPLDLRSPPGTVKIVNIVGAAALDRMGFWMREGDVSGDGVDDLAVGADQEDNGGATNAGAVYVVRGGSHLNANLTIDLADFGSTAIAGHIFKILPPAGSERFHLGSTLAVADLDGNLRAEVLAAASLNRAAGGLLAEGAPAGSAEGSGANNGGAVFILWDDNVPVGSPWPSGLTFTMGSLPMSYTRIDGGTVTGQFSNHRLGEEILGGLDYNGDMEADLFLGDITGQPLDRPFGGLGHVFYSAADLKNRSFDMGSVPGDIEWTTFYGPEDVAISSDTAAHGDFDNDGFDDVAIGSPKANPFGRMGAGTIHVVWGQAQNWPGTVDLQDGMKPSPTAVRITDIFGAYGQTSDEDHGDVLMYSASSADMNNDGRVDLIVNEMLGNGIAPAALDVGHVIIISGARIPKE